MSEESMQAFGRACADRDSVEELLSGLEAGSDDELMYIMDDGSLAECIEWDLTPLEWVRGRILALFYTLAEPTPEWTEAETAARALKAWGVTVETREDKNGFFHYSVLRGRRVLERMARTVPCVRRPPAQD